MKYIGKEIFQIIPNRPPYMIMDSLEVIENKAIAEIALKDDLWIFACHYPGRPILPLTLLVESMTQTFSATFLSQAEDKTGDSCNLFIRRDSTERRFATRR